MSNGLSLDLVQMASRKEGICPCGRIRIYSPGSYENILGMFFPKSFSFFFFFLNERCAKFYILCVLKYVQIYEGRKDLRSGRYMNDKDTTQGFDLIC